ncbi:MAG TPA: N-acetylneuraminate synthase, partial [Chloroflexi bacterium]|nr:N-acetylneuraminate synthase [Chloroflexota bacterium]
TREMIDVLRPAEKGAIAAGDLDAVVGTKALRPIVKGEALRWTMLGE